MVSVVAAFPGCCKNFQGEHLLDSLGTRGLMIYLYTYIWGNLHVSCSRGPQEQGGGISQQREVGSTGKQNDDLGINMRADVRCPAAGRVVEDWRQRAPGGFSLCSKGRDCARMERVLTEPTLGPRATRAVVTYVLCMHSCLMDLGCSHFWP